ncbi:TIGR02808 family protein [Motiliproteus sp. SC1-56]|nr:TIGR02808 family protein [Motiliproteus sp. SC1-56]
MSAIEQTIWTILGYLAMPTFFIIGFAVTALIACIIMDLLEIESFEHY